MGVFRRHGGVRDRQGAFDCVRCAGEERDMADLVRAGDYHMVAKVARPVAGDADRREVERAERV